MCGLVNRPTAERCECGHHFDEGGRELRGFLVTRLTVGWSMVICGLVLTLASVLLIVFVTFWIGVPAAIASVGLFVKGTRIVDATRQGLRDLDALPAARVVQR